MNEGIIATRLGLTGIPNAAEDVMIADPSHAIAIGGALAGFAGGFLCVADVGIFTTNMTVGQGFIALALAMVGNWSPWRIAVGAIVFGVPAYGSWSNG